MPVLVVENDHVMRLIATMLDPASPDERRAAYQLYVGHEVPDLGRWIEEALAGAPGLRPSRVTLVSDQAELAAALPEADVVIVEELRLGRAELDAAPQLALVQKFGTSLANIDTDACAARGLPVLTRRRLTNIVVAEHTLALIMALAKRLEAVSGVVTDERLTAVGFTPTVFDTRHTAAANWGRVPRLMRLHGATLGIVGFGEVGRELSRMARGIGMEVVYFKRNRLSEAEEGELGVSYAPLEHLLARSDVVSLNLPKEARDVINAAAFAQMKPGALLVNTARAASVNKAALIEALASGRLGGAGFDVHYREPVPADEPLLAFDNMLLTPHLAGGSRYNVLDDIAAMLGGISAALQARGASFR